MILNIVLSLLAFFAAAYGAPTGDPPQIMQLIPTQTTGITIMSPVSDADDGKFDLIPDAPLILSDRQLEEQINFAVNETRSGFAQVTSVGVTVQRGTTALLRYRIKAKAIQSEKLSDLDRSFESTLSQSERETYRLRKSSYGGGLNVPFLSFVGINLGGRTEKVDMERSFDSQRDYNQKSKVVQEILESTVEQDIEISGKLTAVGTSLIPTTVVAFIKIGRITMQDGTTRTVISNDPGELRAGTPDGRTVPSEGGTIEILPL